MLKFYLVPDEAESQIVLTVGHKSWIFIIFWPFWFSPSIAIQEKSVLGRFLPEKLGKVKGSFEYSYLRLQMVKLNTTKRLWKFKLLLKFWELFGFLAHLKPKNFSLLFYHEQPFISVIVLKPGQTHPKVEQEHNKWLPRPYDLHPGQENNLIATFIWPKAFISFS